MSLDILYQMAYQRSLRLGFDPPAYPLTAFAPKAKGIKT